ncbi:uncharacterized protein [Watersipora subatra]|uniref:uncharacterized protein n=1 Tax=Watersipora subatra TaxID=2589382 RepID=UPI00355C8DC5
MNRVFGWLKTAGYALALSTSFEILYYLINLRAPKSSVNREPEVDVIFFPDQKQACDAYFSYGCTNKSCWLSHEETSSMKVKQFIEKTRRSLDICVYCIASQTMVDSVLEAHSQGVLVRVVTDQAQASEHSAMVEKLRSSGIEVRTNNSTFFMHHKFVISDNTQVMTGSFNWSRNAMLGNDENITFIRGEGQITQRYIDEFEKLWNNYSPELKS